VDTLVLIPTLKIYVFPYSGRTDKWTDRQTDGGIAGNNQDKCSEKATRTFPNSYIGIVDFYDTGGLVSRNNTEFYSECAPKIFASLISLYICNFFSTYIITAKLA
jgi:hypothetical protein